MIHLVQRRKVIITFVIAILDLQSFVRVHVEEGEFAVREFTCMRHRWTEQPATEQQKPDNRCFEERSAGPGPGILMLQRTTPGENALRPSEKLAPLYQTEPGSVKVQI